MKFAYISTYEPKVIEYNPYKCTFKNDRLEIINTEHSKQTLRYATELIGKFAICKHDYSCYSFIFHINQNTEELEKLLQMFIMFKLEFSNSNIQSDQDYIKQIVDIITLYNEISK